jgi:hypothetical protein
MAPIAAMQQLVSSCSCGSGASIGITAPTASRTPSATRFDGVLSSAMSDAYDV